MKNWDVYQGYKTNKQDGDTKNSLEEGLRTKRKFVAPRHYFKCIQPVFYINQNEKIREIYNSTVLNCFIPRMKTSPDSMKTVLNKINKNRLTIVADCSNAYFLIKIAQESLKYLGADASGLDPDRTTNLGTRDKELFGYSILPFGLRITVYVFCRMTEHWKNFLNLFSDTASFIDDFLIALPLGVSKKDALTVGDHIWNWAEMLQIPLSDKNKNVPDFMNTFIGYWFDSRTQELRPKPKRLIKLASMIVKIIDSKEITLKEVTSLMATLSSMALAFPFSTLVIKMLSRLFAYAANAPNYNPKNTSEIMISVDNYMLDFFAEWLEIIATITEPGKFKESRACTNYLISDVGEKKTGGYMFTNNTITNVVSEDLPETILGTSSTEREIYGFLRLLKRLIPKLIKKGIKHVNFICDNFACMASLLLKGSTCPVTNGICTEILQLLKTNKIDFTCKCLNGRGERNPQHP